MLAEQKEKLMNKTGEFLCLGITADGRPVGIINVPWKSTANAYNMRLPDVYITPEDLHNEEIMSRIKEFFVSGCYIWVPLEDYGFLSEFKDIMDISIKDGSGVKNLSYLEGLTECTMLYLRDAHLENLEELVKAKKSSAKPRTLSNICLDGCVVDDLSHFEGEKLFFNELTVFMPERSNEKDRWTAVSKRCNYFEYRIKKEKI